jgi:transposase
MMNHPPAVCEKAQRMERLLHRVAKGEALAQVCADLNLQVAPEAVAKLQSKYEAGGQSWEALIDGRYGHAQRANSAIREWLYERKREDEWLTAGQLAEGVQAEFAVALSEGHINYLLRKVGLTRPPGRPAKRVRESQAEQSQAEEVSEQSLANAGLFFPGRGQAGDGGGREG